MFRNFRRQEAIRNGMNGFLAQKMIRHVSDKATDNKDLNIIKRLIQPEKKRFLIAAITSALSSGLFMLYPQVMPQLSKLYDGKYEKEDKNDSEETAKAKKEKNQEINFSYTRFLLTWGGISAASGFLNFGRRYINGDLGNRIAIRMRQAIYKELLGKEASFFFNKQSSTAKIVHKLGNDVSAVSQSLSMDLFMAFRGILFIGGGSAFLFFQSPDLIMPSLFVMAGLSVSSRFIGKYQRKYKLEEANELTRTSEQAQETLQNFKLIKISDTVLKEQIDYSGTLAKFYNVSKKVQFWTALNYGFLESFGLFSLIGILCYGSFLVSSGLATPELLSSSMYAFYVGLGVRSLANTYTELKKTTGLYQGIVDVVGSDITASQVYHDNNLLEENHRLLNINRNDASFYQQLYKDTVHQHQTKPPTISIKGVTFKYQEYGKDRSLLSNLTIEIESGSVVALVGPSGCGKTTILNLLTKLYEPSQGEIYVDGVSLTTKTSQWVQQNVSYVTQEPMLFQETIFYNIIYGNQGFNISKENVIEAAKMANAHDFIMSLPDGYDTKLSERGSDLSGGQRQRIILARAVLKDPKILILDEGTANLDSESEKAIINDLKTLSKNRTCIIVTHKIENYLGFVNKIIELSPQISKEEQDNKQEKEAEKQ